jgi:molecular chaperone HtpG
VIEYTGLLFIPSAQPFDLFDPMRRPSVKLYVRRVFITDDCEDILPGYLRFLKGVIDSEDLPLNISREMLQNNPVVAKIRQAVTKRVLSDLEKEAKDAGRYAEFWKTFGAVLKEGIYEDAGNRETLLKLARFGTSRDDALVSLDEYVARMGEGQAAIYYLTADDLEAARRSPQLEGFAARGIEVLLLTDPVDNFWLQAVSDYAGKPLKSVTRGAADLDDTADADSQEKDDTAKGGMDALVAGIKLALGDAVKDVRLSKRLTDSPVCLVAEDGDMDINLQKILKAHNRAGDIARVLEINPRHALVKRLAALAAKDGAADALNDPAHLLLDQARIFEGEPLPDPKAFITRMAAVMERGLDE